MGIASENHGTKVINIRAMIIAKKKGRALTVTLAMVVLPTPQPMKRHVPTGGVQRPRQRFAMMMMPKCMSDSPNCRTTGSRIGVKISSAGVMSMNMPTTSSMALIVSRIMTGFFESPMSVADTVCGMLVTVMIQDMALDAPIRSITTAVVMPV